MKREDMRSSRSLLQLPGVPHVFGSVARLCKPKSVQQKVQANAAPLSCRESCVVCKAAKLTVVVCCSHAPSTPPSLLWRPCRTRPVPCRAKPGLLMGLGVSSAGCAQGSENRALHDSCRCGARLHARLPPLGPRPPHQQQQQHTTKTTICPLRCIIKPLARSLLRPSLVSRPVALLFSLASSPSRLLVTARSLLHSLGQHRHAHHRLQLDSRPRGQGHDGIHALTLAKPSLHGSAHCSHRNTPATVFLPSRGHCKLFVSRLQPHRDRSRTIHPPRVFHTRNSTQLQDRRRPSFHVAPTPRVLVFLASSPTRSRKDVGTVDTVDTYRPSLRPPLPAGAR